MNEGQIEAMYQRDCDKANDDYTDALREALNKRNERLKKYRKEHCDE